MTTSLRLAIIPTPSSTTSEPTEQLHLRVLTIRTPPNTTLSQLRAHAPAGALPDHPAIDGLAVGEDAVIGRYPLVDGSLLEPDTRTAPCPHPLVMVCVSGPRQGSAVTLAPGAMELGRAHALIGDDDLASRRHVRVRLHRGEVSVEDLDSSNGVTLEGRRIPPEGTVPWQVGAHLRVGASVIRLDVCDPPASAGHDLPDGAQEHIGSSAHLLARAPDRVDLPVPRTFAWPEPPERSRSAPLRWIAALAPVPVAGILAYVMHSPMILCFMALGPLVMVLTHVDDRRRGRRSGRTEKMRHGDAVRRTTAEVARCLVEERDALRRLAPDPARLLRIAAGHCPGYGMRRGENAGLLRLGQGDAPSRHRITHTGATHRGPDLDEAPACLRVEPATLIHLDLEEALAPRVLELLTTQLAVLCVDSSGPAHVITPLARTPRWLWAVRSALVTVSTQPPHELLAHLAGAPSDQLPPGSPPLVVLDEATPEAAELARRLVHAGGPVIWVGERPPVLAPGSGGRPAPIHHVRLRSGHRTSFLATGHAFTLDSPDDTWFSSVMRLQTRWGAAAGGATASDDAMGTSTPHEVLPHDVEAAWRAPTLDVPIGRGADGVMTLDLARCGPHALVAGTTGSGKSEFLLTYLRGLFTLNPPTHVTALLIDYKGGATFGALTKAPHVVGVVTDLDDGLAARALIALRAEIKRREHLLASLGVASFREYERLVDGGSTSEVGDGRLARLFVVVDEFRVLAEELPEFVTGLVRLAAVGRSLGMHLVLATQRPGGAVTADMRANLDARIALRVRERADSLDVIDGPEASRISPRTPGRGYLAAAGEAPAPFQSAYSGAARAVAGATGSTHVHPTRMTGTGPEEDTADCLACRPATMSEQSDLEIFVQEAAAAARTIPRPHRPLLPPLAEQLSLRHDEFGAQPAACIDLVALTAPTPGLEPTAARGRHARAGGAEFAGLADLPAAQSQPLVRFTAGTHVGIAGCPGSGRTHAARALADAARAAGEVDVWWVGTTQETGYDDWIESGDPDEVVRLLTLLASQRDTDARAVVVIDGWEELHTTLLRINHGAAVEDMHRRIAEAHRSGLTFVITGARAVIASKVSALLGVRLVLRQNDPSEYSLAGLRPAQVPTAMPPGRARAAPWARHADTIRRGADVTG